MEFRMKKIALLLGALIFAGGLIILSYQMLAPISEYKSNNRDERMIIRLLMDFTRARNNEDVEGFLAAFHDDALYMMEPDVMARKNELKSYLPDLWHKGAGRCITWECIDENCCGPWIFSNPQFSIESNKASLQLDLRASFYRGRLYLDLVKEQNKWLITRLTRPNN